jgi:hypothetical protein
MYLYRRHVSALAMDHHQVYTNVIRVLYRCYVRYNRAAANESSLWYLTASGVYIRCHTTMEEVQGVIPCGIVHRQVRRIL